MDCSSSIDEFRGEVLSSESHLQVALAYTAHVCGKEMESIPQAPNRANAGLRADGLPTVVMPVNSCIPFADLLKKALLPPRRGEKGQTLLFLRAAVLPMNQTHNCFIESHL